jgi:hypothetical protein
MKESEKKRKNDRLKEREEGKKQNKERRRNEGKTEVFQSLFIYLSFLPS